MNTTDLTQSPSIIRIILTNISRYLLLCFCALVCTAIGGAIALDNYNPALETIEAIDNGVFIYADGGLHLFWTVMGLYFIGKIIRELYRRKTLAA